ncbi:hypothetical protein BC343_20455 [Mucilaginibacter pedocola]|uniref:Single-stranded DNA-binding protein n=1 Tax=Mucilaginibacter pedocola TaxID=1792845 RepID=A0A1S9PK78_9SPHI|nr:hypothetical protein BC343_20455 [Mucilaginibacter pedocola]
MSYNYSVNKVILLGYIDSPVVSNSEFITFLLCTAEKINRNNNMIGHNEIHRIKIPIGQSVSELIKLKTGTKLYVEGKLQTTVLPDAGTGRIYHKDIIVTNYEILENHLE